MDAGRFAGIFAQRPTEWIAMSIPGAGTLCGYTRHLRTCRYVAILVNRPSGISQAAAIAVNCTQGVNTPHVCVLLFGFHLLFPNLSFCFLFPVLLLLKEPYRYLLWYWIGASNYVYKFVSSTSP